MADPRLSASLEGYMDKRATFAHDGTIVYDATKKGGAAQVNLAVTIQTTSKVVSTVGADEGILGQLVKVESDGLCVVQTHGHMKLPAGTTPGFAFMGKLVGLLLSSAEGYVGNIDAAGEAYYSRGMVLDTTTTTVEVNGSDVDAVEVLM